MSAISALTVPPSYTPKPAPTPAPALVPADGDGDQASSPAAPPGKTGRVLNVTA
jgi:hypothetical protein